MKFFFIGILLLLLSACLSEPDCAVTATTIVKIALKKAGKDTVNFVRFSSITVSGTDNTFQNVKDSVSSLQLPVNPRSTQTTFKFAYITRINALPVSKTDSVTLSYAIKNIVISPLCGAYSYYSGLSVSSTSFAIIPKVVNSQLSTGATTNLEIKL